MSSQPGAKHVDGLVQSMTGAGTAAGDSELGCLSVECRSVNGRGLHVKTRLAAACSGFEAAIEARVRQRISRGSVHVAVAVDETPQVTRYELNRQFGEQVAQQLEAFAAQVGKTVTLADILRYPGVVDATARSGPSLSRDLLPGVAGVLDQAIDALITDREREGQATVALMLQEVDAITEALQEVRAIAPQVVASYRERLLERVNEFLDGRARAMEPSEVIREVSVFADRVDISEEMQRLDIHIAKARDLLGGGGAVGRNFEFLVQEILREINTLGSKSPDVRVAHLVVRMKSSVDKLKEQAANLE